MNFLDGKILKNKNCVIIGASRGIGKQLSEILASYGCNLFLISKNEENLIKISDELIKNYNCKISYLAVDLSFDTNFSHALSKIKNFFEHIDILINSAAIFEINSITDSTIESFDRCYTLNVKAPFYFSKHFVDGMIKQNWGRIINIGSSSSYNGFSNSSIYCTTKHALLGFSRSLHEEVKHYNVRCYCISPSSTKTEMGKKSSNQNFETFIEPHEIAESIIFAISYNGNMVMNEFRLNRMKFE